MSINHIEGKRTCPECQFEGGHSQGCSQRICGHMILTPTPEHNGGMTCAENKPCPFHDLKVKMELKYCKICVQMTNHNQELCMKCRNGQSLGNSLLNPPESEEWDRLEPETIDHLSTIIMCILDEDSQELRDKHYEDIKSYINSWVKFRSQFVRDLVRSEKLKSREEGYKQGRVEGFVERGNEMASDFMKVRQEGREEMREEIEKWAYGNGITDKKSFTALVKFLAAIKRK